MKAIMLMFDSLNRHYLPNYGCDWTKLPNFERLAQKTVTFDTFYAGSLPCMPARRELHTGRPHFLHSDWSCLQPQDFSLFEEMTQNGIYSHIVTDHFHYWEDGGNSYLQRYSSFEMIRGQQGDPWIGQVAAPAIPANDSKRTGNPRWRQDWVNRGYLDKEEKMPQYLTMERGLDFIHRSHDQDNWFLQIECFDPHEPFFAQPAFQQLYPHEYTGKHFDWPDYGWIEDKEKIRHIRYEYAALLSMCDAYLGKLLDTMDQYDLWRDTMLIVNTDHGFLLGEHGYIGKNIMPLYEELSHLPFFMYDPRNGKQGERCSALAQTIDIPVTLAGYFGIRPPKYAVGEDLSQMVETGEANRTSAVFGVFGGMLNITDGRYVYMKAPVHSENQPLFNYTLIPNHMNWRFKKEELSNIQITGEFAFTDGIQLMKLPAKVGLPECLQRDRLFDLTADPYQQASLEQESVRQRLEQQLIEYLIACEAPGDQWERFALNPKKN